MTFSYNLTSPVADNARVRFALGDVIVDGAIFSDEEIAFQLAETGTWQKTVIACIESVIARLAATPDFRADWLQVSQATALAQWQLLLKTKRMEYGISLITARTGYTFRPDSWMTEAPTFDDTDDD